MSNNPKNFDPKDYSDVHRALVQLLLKKGFLYTKDALDVLPKFLVAYGYAIHDENDQPIDNFESNNKAPLIEALKICLEKINANLKPLSMKIKQAYCEETGKQIQVLVNRMESSLTVKTMYDYTPTELEYFKKLVALMFESDDCLAGCLNCLLLAEQLEKKLSMAEAQTFIDRLKSDSWLIEKNGHLTLHARAVNELEPFLLEEFGGLDKCPICDSIVLASTDQKCSKCLKKSHKFCVERHAKKHKKSKVCLHENCGEPWEPS